MTYAKKRYLTYGLLTVFILLTPFITINNNHLLLLSFDKMQFHFLGTSYNMNELFIMPFLLMFLFIGIFAMTSMFGRVWCGWACPQTVFRVVFRDLIESKLLKLRRIKNKQKEINYNKNINRIKKYFALFIWGFLCFVIACNFMLYFISYHDFFIYIQNPQEHVLLYMFIFSIALFLIYDIVFMKEHFCTYVCPYSRIQSTLYDNNTKQVVYDKNRGVTNNECIDCNACVSICPTNIDIKKGLQVECINCLECVDSCTKIMSNFNKESLIKWTSTHNINSKKKIYFPLKSLIYTLCLSLCIVFAAYFAYQKTEILVHANKTSNLYRINENSVSNNYILTLQNRSDKSMKVGVQIINNKDITIKRFKMARLKKDQRIKTILILKSSKALNLSNKKDTPIEVMIKVYDKNNPKVFTLKKLSFMYPKTTLLK